MICICLRWFDCFYGLLGNKIFRTFSNISFSLCLSVSPCLFLSLSVSLCLSVTLSVSLCLSLLSLCLSLFYAWNRMHILPFQYNYISIRNPGNLRLSLTVVCGPVAIYIVTFREINILRTLKRLAAATKRFSEKQKFVNIRTFLYR